MVSGNNCKYYNVIKSQKTVFQDYFSSFQDYFSMLRKARFLYYFRAALKKLTLNLSAIMCYVMKTVNIKLQKYSFLLLNIKGEITPFLSNEWLYKLTITMYYCFHYKFERNPTEKSVLTSSELINKILTVLSICARKIQSSQSM